MAVNHLWLGSIPRLPTQYIFSNSSMVELTTVNRATLDRYQVRERSK